MNASLTALTACTRSARGSWAFQLFIEIFIHGFCHRKAVYAVMTGFKLPSAEPSRHTERWWARIMHALRKGLKAGRAHKSPKQLPYHWVKDGVLIGHSLLPHARDIMRACATIARAEVASIQVIDRALPRNMGWYSMNETKCCPYMRRHLARWMAVFLAPRSSPSPAGWNLLTKGIFRSCPPLSRFCVEHCPCRDFHTTIVGSAHIIFCCSRSCLKFMCKALSL